MSEAKLETEKSKRQKAQLSRVKKLDADAARLLASIREKVNKKEHGRKVRDAEILAKALGLLTQEHITALQAQTYSQKDHLQMAYEFHQKQNGKTTMDDFLGLLMRGELKQKPSIDTAPVGSIPLK